MAKETPCDYGECPYDAMYSEACRYYCGLGVDEACDDDEYEEDIENESLTNVINDIKYLLALSEHNSKNAAAGYDEGWYNGECNAYEIVLEKLENIIKM